MHDVSLWSEVLGVERAVFESVQYDQVQDLVVARVRPTKRAQRLGSDLLMARL